MSAYESFPLTRDVIGVLIPAGTRVELPAGAVATITQALGGSFTVEVDGHLFRIDGNDADALGRPVAEAPELDAEASIESVAAAAWEQMKTCFDPEIPINIVDLGLIYECQVEPLSGGTRKVVVRMTLTAPGCGMGDVLVSDVREKLLRIPTVTETDIELVFDPPWTREHMSEAAQLQAGFL
jgi:probable FeS assembly SUF system protein SufT